MFTGRFYIMSSVSWVSVWGIRTNMLIWGTEHRLIVYILIHVTEEQVYSECWWSRCEQVWGRQQQTALIGCRGRPRGRWTAGRWWWTLWWAAGTVGPPETPPGLSWWSVRWPPRRWLPPPRCPPRSPARHKTAASGPNATSSLCILGILGGSASRYQEYFYITNDSSTLIPVFSPLPGVLNLQSPGGGFTAGDSGQGHIRTRTPSCRNNKLYLLKTKCFMSSQEKQCCCCWRKSFLVMWKYIKH